MKISNNIFWENKRVIVTGSTGFLGHNFVNFLYELRAKVIPINHNSVDLLDYKQTVKSICNAEIIINCAGLDGNYEYKEKNSAEICDSNIKICSNILNASKINAIPKVVLISSTDIYQDKKLTTFSEKDDNCSFNDYGDNGYVISKTYCEILGQLYQKQYGLNVFNPRPGNIYGPKDHFDKVDSRVIPNIIKKIANNIPVEIIGDGSKKIQPIYIDDVIKTILKMIQEGFEDKINIVSNKPITILELVNTIFKIFNKKPNIIFITNKQVNNRERIIDSSKMIKFINFTPIELEEGLAKTINWYKNSVLVQ